MNAAGAALGEEAADAAGSDGGVLLAEGVHRCNRQVGGGGVAHGVGLAAQAVLLGDPHLEGHPFAGSLRQPEDGHVLLRVVVHQISLRLVVLVKADVELSAPQGLARQDEFLHHMAVGDDVLGVLSRLPYKEAGAPPVIHSSVLVRRAGGDHDDTVEGVVVKCGEGRHGQHTGQQHRQQHRGKFPNLSHIRSPIFYYWQEINIPV